MNATAVDLLPGFSDPVLDAQALFRGLLQALSRPGTLVDLAGPPQAPAPLNPAAAATCLTLLDMDTRLWTDTPSGTPSGAMAAWLAFHCGCPVTKGRAEADFALITRPADLENWTGFNPGSAEFPEKSTCLLIQVAGFGAGPGAILSGPGIPEPLELKVQGLSGEFWPSFQQMNAHFPLGLDAFLLAPDRVCGLPRSCRLELS